MGGVCEWDSTDHGTAGKGQRHVDSTNDGGHLRDGLDHLPILSYDATYRVTHQGPSLLVRSEPAGPYDPSPPPPTHPGWRARGRRHVPPPPAPRPAPPHGPP